ncbi:DUF4169 family protein [Albirhodobacter sp. R86504]|jgi:hypothetical protein|uniref:DUF4169 family protein n=1 Tax=Albirhodobacter sp. R86504 TaxID=3093848 RepID=UPI0036732157
MSNVTNLNQFRKAKARADKRVTADANATKFGRTKAQRALEEAQSQRARSSLDGHEIAPPKDDDAP